MMILKDTQWRTQAACLSAVGEGDHRGDEWENGRETTGAALKRLRNFIKTCCDVCPVAQQCLDSSYNDDTGYDDLKWTVRGGYMPLKQVTLGRGRPPGSKSKDWKPKPPPEGATPWNDYRSLLEVGVCRSGQHGILDEDDIYVGSNYSRTCRACHRATSGRVAAAKRAQREAEGKHGDGSNIRPYWPHALRVGKCGKGHPVTSPDDLNFFTSRGKDRSQCKTCAYGRKKADTASKTHCSRGHEYNMLNTTYVEQKNGRKRRFCRVCNSMRVDRLMAAKMSA